MQIHKTDKSVQTREKVSKLDRQWSKQLTPKLGLKWVELKAFQG